MKKLLIGLPLFAFVLGWLPQPSTTHNPEEALEQVRQQFYASLDQFVDKVAAYQTLATTYHAHPSADPTTLQQIHLETRLAFKRVEYMLEYYDRQTVKKQLNGPPLPAVEPNVPVVNILSPKGLQVLDELVFGEDIAPEDVDKIRQQIGQLQVSVLQLASYLQAQSPSHRHVFEASRLEIVRIFTLGLTGFDTPGSANALPEATAAWQTIFQALQAYSPLLHAQNPLLADSLTLTMQGALEFLQQHQDFERFDRLYFLRQYCGPAYRLVYQAQLALGVETLSEVSPGTPRPTREEATHFFSTDFFNPTYYAGFDTHDPWHAQKVALGRVLFFDPILSDNNQRACASCHRPELAFTDGEPKSMSIDKQGRVSRNAPTLLNCLYAERYFHDMREPQLERQIKHVVLDTLEFNTDFFDILAKLQQSEEYKSYFAQAYPNLPQYQISTYTVSNALAAYVASLVSFNSPFDQYVRQESNQLDPAAYRGFNLFMGKAACGTCHFAPVFNGTVPPYFEETESEVLATPDSIGQPAYVDADPGRIASGRPHDQAPFYLFSFKTPTVRNIALTAPYMHNGVYHTLEEVIDFYNLGGGAGLGLDVPHQTLPPDPLNLTTTEITDLVRFMESLTDTAGLGLRPEKLPTFANQPTWNQRPVGGSY